MKGYDLYLIINKVNGKRYVGITKIGFKARFEKHLINAERFYKRHRNIILYYAIRKHGSENFTIEFLAEGDDWNHLKQLEIEAINNYNTYIHDDNAWGYNQTRGGDGTDGYKFTDKQLAKRTERGLTEDHKVKIKANNAKYWLGKNHTQETIDKIKAARAKQIITDETREKHRQKWLGSKNPNARAVIIDDTIFETLKDAAEYVGIHPDRLRDKIKSNKIPNWKYLDEK